MLFSLVSDELYRDPSGVRLPIGMASLDRLDPDGHYSLENLRILFTPFNLIRRAAQDDIGITRYLEQIDPGATERADALKKEVSHHMKSTCLWRPPADGTTLFPFLPFSSCFSFPVLLVSWHPYRGSKCPLAIGRKILLRAGLAKVVTGTTTPSTTRCLSRRRIRRRSRMGLFWDILYIPRLRLA